MTLVKNIADLLLILSLILQRKAGQRIDEDVVNLPADIFGRPKAPAGTLASGIHIIDPVEVREDFIGYIYLF